MTPASTPRRRWWPGSARRRAGRGLVLLGLAALLGWPVSPVAPDPTAAVAAGRVDVESRLGNARAAVDGPTPVRVSGSGFQSVRGGFGGIYVLFGWVSDPDGGGWRPSNGGQTGRTYLYVPDSESANNQGYQRFVTFPGSSTSEAANGGEVAEDGTFALDMVIPGPTFTGRDRDGAERRIDCREVICGIITVGAHGVVNATNESFTPVSFETGDVAGDAGADQAAPQQQSDAGAAGSGSGEGSAAGTGSGGSDAAADGSSADQVEGSGAPGSDGQDPTTGSETDPVPAGSGGTDPAGAPPPAATVGVEQTTVVAGRVVAFTGQEFSAGEQVVASLGGGLAAVGPLVAGPAGEVAGVLSLPVDVRPGSHALTLVGAASGGTSEVAIQVVPDPVLAAAEANARDAAAPDGWDWALLAVGGLGVALALLVLSAAVTAVVRRRRAAAGTSSPRAPGRRRAVGAPVAGGTGAVGPSTATTDLWTDGGSR